MPTPRPSESKLRLEESEDFDARATRPLSRLARPPIRERVRPNRLFARVAALLRRDPVTVVTLLGAELASADAAPQAFTREQLTMIAPYLLELIETELPPGLRAGARDGLAALLTEDGADAAPADLGE